MNKLEVQIGYGAGYVIPTYYGVSTVLSLVICLVAGAVLDRVGNQLIFSSSVQKSTGKKGVCFLGIPYATAERWKKPVPVSASGKLREA